MCEIEWVEIRSMLIVNDMEVKEYEEWVVNVDIIWFETGWSLEWLFENWWIQGLILLESSRMIDKRKWSIDYENSKVDWEWYDCDVNKLCGIVREWMWKRHW